MFSFLEEAATAEVGLEDACSTDSNLLFIFQVARWIIRILQIAVPFVLIIWGSIDFFKAVVAGDEKEMKQKRKPFVQRVIAALIIILLPTLVNLILKSVAASTNNRFADCWTAASPDNPFDPHTTHDTDESWIKAEDAKDGDN